MMASTGLRERRPDLLTAVTPVASVLVGLLEKGKFSDAKTLQSLRLTCHDFRALVDGDLTVLSLKVKKHHREQWAAGRLPSLERWSACNHVRLQLEPSGDGDEDLAALASIPFSGLAPRGRERISWLELSIVPGLHPNAAWQAEAAVTVLATMLPGLSFLSLCGMSYDTVRQRLMFQALASLPCLGKLALPSSRALEHIGLLATGKLTALQVLSLNSLRQGQELLSPQAAAGLAQLHGLQKICWQDGAAEWRGLNQLLDHVPPTISTVYFFNGEIKTYLAMRAGRAQRLRILMNCRAPPVGQIPEARAFVSIAEAVLSSRAMGPRLDSLILIPGVRVADPDGRSLEAPELQPLWDLARRSDAVAICMLRTSSAAGAVAAVTRLGVPQALDLQRNATERLVLRLRRNIATTNRQQYQHQQHQHQVAAAAAAPPGQEALTTSLLLRLASGGANPGNGTAGPPPSQPRPLAQVFVFRGPFVSTLSWVPSALHEWLQGLTRSVAERLRMGSEQSAVAGGGGGDGSGGIDAGHGGNDNGANGGGNDNGTGGAGPSGGQRVQLLSYQVLPRSCGAVLAAFRGVEGLLGAVEAVASSMSAESGHAGGPLLEVTQAAAALAEGGKVTGGTGAVRRMVLKGLQLELQSRWDASLPGCGGDPAAEAALLRGLLGAWEQLVAEMLPEVEV
ncbi:hypothetical protein GPECTOR_52g10 [Gonium pectorale]|uniref:Uncharacterized protein n=1 Tax=Gonium pectorale TaxID=33097 RepID=A0A150G6Y5_GONPE|nr:hypothetical protein GPECTOR_52g10 [Gonium pectorale]|eukprot:KXZ45607.1 hypothetical protein GPECTOR_52g10 [Gonium pectorale]